MTSSCLCPSLSNASNDQSLNFCNFLMRGSNDFSTFLFSSSQESRQYTISFFSWSNSFLSFLISLSSSFNSLSHINWACLAWLLVFSTFCKSDLETITLSGTSRLPAIVRSNTCSVFIFKT